LLKLCHGPLDSLGFGGGLDLANRFRLAASLQIGRGLRDMAGTDSAGPRRRRAWLSDASFRCRPGADRNQGDANPRRAKWRGERCSTAGNFILGSLRDENANYSALSPPL
jgi:hypothetical protein